MSRFILIVAVAAVMASSLAVAGPLDTEEFGDHYYFTASSLADSNKFNPTDLLGNLWNVPPYIALSPLKDSTKLNLSLPASGYLVLALGNASYPGNRKTLVVRIEGVGLAASQLQFIKAGFGYATPPANRTGGPVVENRDTVGVYRASYMFDPQPDWEWIVIKNNGPTMNSLKVFWASRCVVSPNPYPRVPSLTTWGLLVLVGLLAATAIWVIRKRSTGLAT